MSKTRKNAAFKGMVSKGWAATLMFSASAALMTGCSSPELPMEPAETSDTTEGTSQKESVVAEETPEAVQEELADQDRPNILWIMTEDINPRLGCYGDTVAITPTIDSMAEDGVMFTNAYSTAGVCAPSRAAFITGLYQQSFGAQNHTAAGGGYKSTPDEDVKAFPELLRAGGYYTFTCSKLDYQYSSLLCDSGPFTIWDNDDAALELWEGNLEGKPFFGYINILDTHESQIGREPFDDIIKPEDVEVPPYLVDTENTRYEIATLYNNIHHLDGKVAEILDRLEQDGLRDSTIVIFAADNGGNFGREKRELYDTGIHVPMIVNYPEKYRPSNVTPGEANDNLVSYIDVAPSILTLAGVEVPDYMPGQVIFGEHTDEPRQYVYAARDRLDKAYDRQRAVRDERYKYIYNYYLDTTNYVAVKFRDKWLHMQDLIAAWAAGTLNEDQLAWFQPRVEEELYDTWEDPYELHNLADNPDYTDTLERMRKEFHAWMDETVDMAEMPEEDMRKIFQPDGVQPVTAEPAITVESLEEGKIRITASETTRGSSLGYKEVNEIDWHLYTEPLVVPEGTEIIFKAVRYGYDESQPVSLDGKVYEDTTTRQGLGFNIFGDIHFYKGFKPGMENR